MILGKISEVDNANGIKLIIDGESEATTKKYHYLASYVPAAGDRVLIEEISDSYVVIGKVIEAYDDSGKARTAETADTATTADSATTAETATSATSATTAGSATKATQDESGNNIKATYGASLGFTSSNGQLALKNKNGSNLSTVTITASSAAKAEGVVNTSSTSTTIYFRVNGSTFSASTSKNGPWYNLN